MEKNNVADNIKFVLFYLTLKTSSRKYYFKGFNILPNQTAIEINSFSRELNIHISQLKKILEILKETKKIKIEEKEEFMVITVLNQK